MGGEGKALELSKGIQVAAGIQQGLVQLFRDKMTRAKGLGARGIPRRNWQDLIMVTRYFS